MKITEQVRIMENHYNAMKILIEYASMQASKGDRDAIEALRKFDRERDGDA